MRCIPPSIQQMLVHHTHHHHQFLYNINPNMGDLNPPQPPLPPRQLPARPHGHALHEPAPAPRQPQAEPGRMAAAPPARGSWHQNHERSRRGGRTSSTTRGRTSRPRGPLVIESGTGA